MVSSGKKQDNSITSDRLDVAACPPSDSRESIDDAATKPAAGGSDLQSLPSGKVRPENYTIVRAFKCAGAGIFHTLRAERNMKIESCVGVLAIILGFAFRITLEQWLAVVICIALVLALECVNTAVEAVVDLVSPEYNELAKVAKDAAAGATYLVSIGALVVGLLLYLPPIWNVACGLFGWK